jgi:hypothetical protein
MIHDRRYTTLKKTISSPTPAKPPYGTGCTEALVTGLTALNGNMNGQCVDSEVGMWPGFIRLEIPAKGNRYLMAGDGDFFALLNEKGIALSGGFRPARQFPPFPGKPKYASYAEMLRTCNTAADFVKTWADSYTRYGMPWGSNCTLVIDPAEGYCLEGANYVYGDPANHTIHGPMYDQVFVSANFFISKRLKALAELGIGAGYNRAKRLWQLLVDRQYDCNVMQPTRSGISLSYFMKCLRDHGNVAPEEGRLSCYVAEDRGQGALCCHGLWEYTTNAFFGVAKADHTDLFSCEWLTSSQPCISPFLPVYIGVNSLPKALRTTEAFDLFEKLRKATEYHPESREEITQYWTAFEIQTIEESFLLEKTATPLIEKGNVERARVMLTEFVEKKCHEAMTLCQQMIDSLGSLPVLGKTARARTEETRAQKLIK